MGDTSQSRAKSLRGANRLAVEATQGVAALVEAMHDAFGGAPALTRVSVGGVRAAAGLVGAGVDGALAMLEPVLGASSSSGEADALLAVVNGVLGDYLEERGNPLAVSMALTLGGRALPLDEPLAVRNALTRATDRVVVMVHGSCMTEAQWLRSGHDHGLALGRDGGWTRIGVRYNSGLHVSTNGERLAEHLERLVRVWPVPVRSIALLGHSMGGLVSRAACWAAEQRGHAWRSALDALITLGTPHHGAPLERAGNWVDDVLGASRYSAPLARLGKIRSAGVTDLRYGNVVRADWEGRDRFARGGDPRTRIGLPEGVACYAVAGTLGRLGGDGLVPVDSALGLHPDADLGFGGGTGDAQVVEGCGHLDLLDRAEVYRWIRGWLTGT
ncbi:MAG: esterase/lipase family protein [Nannocystaceae bacterium]|nr:GPI inositol-deacylase [bacterium]